MYKNYDKASAIRFVQIYLNKIGQNDIFVAPSGVFDETTRNAVAAFQATIEKPQTGIVDKETLEHLFENYAKVGQTNFPITYKGEYSKRVLYINSILSDLNDHYGFNKYIVVNSLYSEQTHEILIDLSKTYMLDYDGYVYKQLYDRIILDHNSLPRGE